MVYLPSAGAVQFSIHESVEFLLPILRSSATCSCFPLASRMRRCESIAEPCRLALTSIENNSPFLASNTKQSTSDSFSIRPLMAAGTAMATADWGVPFSSFSSENIGKSVTTIGAGVLTASPYETVTRASPRSADVVTCAAESCGKWKPTGSTGTVLPGDIASGYKFVRNGRSETSILYSQ